MNFEQKINKALLLLDKGRSPEAIQLKALLQELDTNTFTGRVNAVRCATILGDYFSQVPDKKETLYWCGHALQLAAAYPELEEVTGYELNLSCRLWSAVSLKPNQQ